MQRLLAAGDGQRWEKKAVSVPLNGNLARQEARGLVLSGAIAQFSPVLLVFAWTRSDGSVVLGHMNFFAEFNVCKTVRQFVESLARGSDRLFTVPDQGSVKFSTAMSISGDKLKLEYKPEDMVFRE